MPGSPSEAIAAAVSSRAPTDEPADTTSTSHPRDKPSTTLLKGSDPFMRARRVAASASRSSATIPAKWGSPPASLTSAARAGAEESRTWPGSRSACVAGTSSSPVETMATRGRACARTSVSPAAASMPRSCARSGRPGRASSVPGAASSSARTIPSPGVAGRRTSISSGVGDWVYSTFRTESRSGRERRAGRDRHGAAGAHLRLGRLSHPRLADQVEVAGEALGGSVGVGRPDGEAVDGRAGEAGEGVRCGDRLGGDAAERVGERDRLDRSAQLRAEAGQGLRHRLDGEELPLPGGAHELGGRVPIGAPRARGRRRSSRWSDRARAPGVAGGAPRFRLASAPGR